MGYEQKIVVWAASALEDLVSELENVAVHFPGMEHDLYDGLMAAAESLASLSNRGRIVPELHDQRTREISSFETTVSGTRSTKIVSPSWQSSLAGATSQPGGASGATGEQPVRHT